VVYEITLKHEMARMKEIIGTITLSSSVQTRVADR
jgi:hypothetical protein